MPEGKILILGWLAQNKEKPFRQRNVVEATNLSRQLISYHMKELINTGVLEKVAGSYYKVASYDKLIDDLLASHSMGGTTKTLSTTFLMDNETKVEGFNLQLRYYLALRALKYKYHPDLRVELLNKLNETLDHLSKVRGYINNSGSLSPSTALRILKNGEELWPAIQKVVFETKEDFESWLAMVEEEETTKESN